MTPSDIALEMTKDNVKLPCDVVGNTHIRTSDEIKRKWNRNTVVKILKNITYIGCVKNGTLKKLSYKSKKILTVPQEDWIISKNMHEPIIDEATFHIVQEQIKSRTRTKKRKYDFLLKGLVECAECGKKLSVLNLKQKNGKHIFYLRCNTYGTATALKLCTPHSNNLEKVTDMVIQMVKERCNEYLKEEKYYGGANTVKQRLLRNKNNIRNEIRVLEKKLEDLNKRIDVVYNDKCNGLLQEDDFNRLYKNTLETRRSTENRIKELKMNAEHDEDIIDIHKIITDFINMKEISRTLLVSLVNKITITQNKEICIYYKFNFLNVHEIVENDSCEKIV